MTITCKIKMSYPRKRIPQTRSLTTQMNMNIKSLPIYLPRAEINLFCLRHHIRKLYLFGSVLRNDFTAQSDVDVLVEFEPEKTPSFFTLVEMQDELGKIVGRVIDLRTPHELSSYFRDRVLTEALEIYDSN